MTFDEWMTHGVTEGWISLIACATHDGIPQTPEEDAEWDAGNDPCIPIFRLWPEAVGW